MRRSNCSTGACRQSCNTSRERLVVLLLSRLGMRIGAVCGLRLAGVVVGFDGLQPPPSTAVAGGSWVVRRFISGRDKGNRINEWDVCFDPSVHAELERYVNAVWRPRYAQWIERDQRMRLVNGFLFPSQYVTGHAERSVSVHTLSGMVKAVLARAGVTGPHAHCHGFRKGVVTELLRAGNPLYAVSRFVHHRSTAVTESSYDSVLFVAEKKIHGR
jgi:integrase